MKQFIFMKQLQAKTALDKVKGKLDSIGRRSDEVLADERGENYVDTAVKILIAIVIGALLLAGLYALFGDVVMPTLTNRIREMFNYSGS